MNDICSEQISKKCKKMNDDSSDENCTECQKVIKKKNSKDKYPQV